MHHSFIGVSCTEHRIIGVSCTKHRVIGVSCTEHRVIGVSCTEHRVIGADSWAVYGSSRMLSGWTPSLLYLLRGQSQNRQ